MSTESGSKYLWLAYCKAWQEIVDESCPPSPNCALFFSTKVQKLPVISSVAEYTNLGISKISDNRLNPDSLFYDPSSRDCYASSVQDYLSWVDFGKGQPNAVVRVVEESLAKLLATQARTRNDQEGAIKDFLKQRRRGLVWSTFEQWAARANPLSGLIGSLVDRDSATNEAAISALSGPIGNQWKSDIANVGRALNSHTVIPGISMGAGIPLSDDQVALVPGQDDDVPSPPVVRYVPEFTSPDYTNKIQDFISREIPGEHSVILKIRQSKSASKSDFRQACPGNQPEFNFSPWIMFDDESLPNAASHLDEADFSDANVSFIMHYNEIKVVEVAAGTWNIKNPKERYQSLKINAPSTARMLVNPSKVILVKNFGFKITFRNHLKDKFAEKIRSLGYSGYVIIFGIAIYVGREYWDRDGPIATHTASWNESTGEFNVEPYPHGRIIVLGTIGEQIPTV